MILSTLANTTEGKFGTKSLCESNMVPIIDRIVSKMPIMAEIVKLSIANFGCSVHL